MLVPSCSRRYKSEVTWIAKLILKSGLKLDLNDSPVPYFKSLFRNKSPKLRAVLKVVRVSSSKLCSEIKVRNYVAS